MTCSLILWLNLISIHSFETPVFVWWLNHLNHQTVDRMNIIATFTWAHPVEKNTKTNINLPKFSVRPTTRSNKKNHKLHPGPRWDIIKKMTCDWVRLYDKTPKRTQKKGRRWPYPLKNGLGMVRFHQRNMGGCLNMGKWFAGFFFEVILFTVFSASKSVLLSGLETGTCRFTSRHFPFLG